MHCRIKARRLRSNTSLSRLWPSAVLQAQSVDRSRPSQQSVNRVPFGVEPGFKCDLAGFEFALPALDLNRIESAPLFFFLLPWLQKARLDGGRAGKRHAR